MNALPPDPDPFDAARELFDELCGADAHLREERLAEVPAELAALVRELLEEDARADSGLDTPPLERRAARTGGQRVPRTLGRFEILERIGAGGMGVVYRARQASPERLVALKVVRSAAISAEGLRRFRHEAEVLARLDHPGIARVWEAGTADTGHGEEPWFAMELVEGRPITRYAREERLDLAARLELIAALCDAIQYAHGKGVIHRDLKPANVLVTADGHPKVLDFGMARATSEESVLSTLHTHTGEVLGTLPYMSPEQLSGDPEAVDTRADVYALGVIAYELLCGELPHELIGRAVHEAARVVAEEEPTTLGARDRALRGDVETIVGKAMAKDAGRRYASAAELAGDVRRYLADEPIVARPPTLGYQLAKFARRNRAFVGGVVGVFLALVAGLVVSTLLYFEKERERKAAADAQVEAERASERERDAHAQADAALKREEDARTKAETAQAQAEDALALRSEMLERFQRMFTASTPWREGMDVRVVDVLDQAVEDSKDAFLDHPLSRANLLTTFAETYSGLGLYDRAVPLSAEAARLSAEHGDPLAAARARAMQGYTLSKADDASGLDLLEQAFAEMEAMGAPLADRVRTGARLCEELQLRGRAADAERYARRALELAGDDPAPELAAPRFTAWKALGDLQVRQGHMDEGRASLEHALEIAESIPDGAMNAILTLNSLAVLDMQTGRAARAAELLDQVLARMRASGADRHEFYTIQLSNAATAQMMLGHPEKAIPLLEQSLSLDRELHPEPTRSRATTLGNLGEALREGGQVQRAVELGREALELQARFHGERSDHVANAQCTLGMALTDAGAYEEGADLLERAIAIKDELTPGHYSTGANVTWLAVARLGLEDWDGAAEAADDALARLRAHDPNARATIDRALATRAIAMALAGEPDYGLASADEAVQLGETFGESAWELWRARALRGLVTALAGDLDAGIEAYDTALARLVALVGSEDPRALRLRALATAALDR